MATISLRRIKDKLLIGLPSKTVETVSLNLSGEERELYDRMESSSKDLIFFKTISGFNGNHFSAENKRQAFNWIAI